MSGELQTLHDLLEADAQQYSSAVFVYDTTPSAPFGEKLKSTNEQDAQVFQMQTRPGAGSALVGYVESVAFSSRGASPAISEADAELANVKVPAKRASQAAPATPKRAKAEAAVNQPVTILASTASLLSLTPSLLSLPASDVRPPLTVHVSAQTSTLATPPDSEEQVATLNQVPDLASLFTAVKTLSASNYEGAVVLSETANEAARVGTGLAKALASANVDLINVFDGQTAGREYAKLASAAAAGAGRSASSIIADFTPAFEYHGSVRAASVIVVPASVYSLGARAALSRLVSTEALGVLVVRVIRPWSGEAFLSALPAGAKSLHFLLPDDESDSEAAFLYEDALSAIMSHAPFKYRLATLSIPTQAVPSVQDWQNTITNVAGSSPAPTVKDLLADNAKLAIFWDLDSTSGSTQTVPLSLARAFGESKTGVDVRLVHKFDNFRQGGVQQAALLLEPSEHAENGLQYGASIVEQLAKPSLLFLSSPQSILKAYNPLSKDTLGADTRIVLATNWTGDDLAAKLPAASKQALASLYRGSNNLYTVDVDKLSQTLRVRGADVQEIVFWSFYLSTGVSPKEIVALLARTPTFAAWDHQKLVEISSSVRNAINAVEVPESWAQEEMKVDGEAPVELPTEIVSTAAGPNAYRTFEEPIAKIDGTPRSSWHKVAQRLMYPESFATENKTKNKLRPDLPEETFLVEVTENRRLTPSDYPRNVFHMELSTKGTGLKYAVGEAVGIHGWNDEQEVLDFINWYGLDPNAVISVPAREDPENRVEQRTIFQTFQQNLDIFGKPGKSFYETLSKYATNKNEERALRFIAAPEGVATFKKFSEVDTVTYADVLRQYPSAKPTIEDLVREIEPIKPRHYSIASSQNFVGDSIHLLIVTVEWETPGGSARYGQCTRYLAGLKPGAKVMVSVRPSVMKLPPKTTDPIIMAGLGTGAAPFRAFIQERAWQRAQGLEVGPALYYFGSRHRSKEYLYGEEIEAYLSAGIVTHTGLAFSRDGPKKVYIQHKMHDDADLIRESLTNGTFYLCGPTEPYGDVNDALIKAHVKGGRTPEEAEAYIASLKDEERLVLELY